MKFLVLFSVVVACTFLGGQARDLSLLRLPTVGRKLGIPIINCESWRWAVETDNAGIFHVVPDECVPYVKEYMDGEVRPGHDRQYVADCYMVAQYIYDHILSVNPSGNGKDVWIFDLDETLLSDLEYYRQPDVNYGARPFNKTKFYEWVATGEVPGLSPFVELYQQVQSKGFKTVIISGTYEEYRQVREANLEKVGVTGWEKLILRTKEERGISAVDYKTAKRAQLVEEGYKIVANIGDQWSDLDGANSGDRIYKVPNPMYYVD